MIFSLVAMTGLEKCCITSAYLQWLCHSGERPVARGPLVVQTPLSLYSLNFAVISPSGAFCHLSRAFQVANSPSIRHYLPNLWMFSTDPNFRNFLTTWLMVILGMPSSVAQSDACPTGDQEVAGLIPAGSGNIIPWRLNLKYFLRSFSPFHWFKKGSCQFLVKECAQQG